MGVISALIPSWKLMRNCLPVNTIPLTLADQNKKVAIGDYWENLESSGAPNRKISTKNRRGQSVKRKKLNFLKGDSMLIS